MSFTLRDAIRQLRMSENANPPPPNKKVVNADRMPDLPKMSILCRSCKNPTTLTTAMPYRTPTGISKMRVRCDHCQASTCIATPKTLLVEPEPVPTAVVGIKAPVKPLKKLNLKDLMSDKPKAKQEPEPEPEQESESDSESDSDSEPKVASEGTKIIASLIGDDDDDSESESDSDLD